MNEIVNKLLLAGDKFMPEMHLCLKFKPAGLAKSGFTYRVVDHLQKTKKIKETRDLQYIYQNELDKACFRHDMG